VEDGDDEVEGFVEPGLFDPAENVGERLPLHGRIMGAGRARSRTAARRANLRTV
jgi:hypothetical protein